MQPTGELRGDVVHVGGDARQRFYDSRGYGRPVSGNEIALSRVEAAHLLFRGDLSGVVPDASGRDTLGFERFFVSSAARTDRFAVRFLVYSDLRDRGFYLSPTRESWPGGTVDVDGDVDLIAYERGSTPASGDVLYPVRIVGERESIPAAELGEVTLAVVDEESDITYFETGTPDVKGETAYEPPGTVSGVLVDDRVVVWEPPDGLYERGFYGQPLTGRATAVENAVQLSLVEAASLARRGALSLSGAVGGERRPPEGETTADRSGSPAATEPERTVRDRGRAVEGDRFNRRLAVYDRLRGRSVVPKTGFKFGADFRTYLDVDHVSDLPHSKQLVRVLEPEHRFSPRELSLDVRLAGGVRKEMMFALTDGDEVDWLSTTRLTP